MGPDFKFGALMRVAAIPAGAGGVIFLPYLQGERTPNLPKGVGVFHCLTTENVKPDVIARAVVEGLTLGLAYGMRRFKPLGMVPEEIRLTGGGSKSAIWRQIASDVLGFPTVAFESRKARLWARRFKPPGPTVRYKANR